jgi:hypothetical protein
VFVSREPGAVSVSGDALLCFGGTGNRTRTCMPYGRWLLRPLRLPIPPSRHEGNVAQSGDPALAWDQRPGRAPSGTVVVRAASNSVDGLRTFVFESTGPREGAGERQLKCRHTSCPGNDILDEICTISIYTI